MNETNPLETCEVPEGFTRVELKRFGVSLVNETKQINWTRNYEKLGGSGPFHVQGRRFDKWAKTLEEAIALARS